MAGTDKLTDTAIRKAKPGEKPVRLFDGGGLYLELAPSGGRWWRLKYRHGGKEKRLSLGTYPDTGLKEARERRDEARKLLAAGMDPSAARKDAKEAERVAALNTFEKVARDWLSRRAPAWTEATRAMIEASLDNHVFPRLGQRPISEIKAREIRDVVQAIELAGARETAGRVFQRVRGVFRHAVAHDIVESDVTLSLRASEILAPHRTTHRASFAERDVPEFLRKLDEYGGDPTTRCALRLLMLTAVRPGELRGAEWHEFDIERALWRVPAARMKMKTEHLVPLSTQALQVLEQLRPLTGSGVLVFPSPFYPNKPLSENTLNSALSRMGFKGIATAHGFRSLFSTAANEAGWNADAVERQLAHEERDEVRGAYNRAQYLADRSRLLQWWADRIDALQKGATVIPLRAA